MVANNNGVQILNAQLNDKICGVVLSNISSL